VEGPAVLSRVLTHALNAVPFESLGFQKPLEPAVDLFRNRKGAFVQDGRQDRNFGGPQILRHHLRSFAARDIRLDYQYKTIG
jgi:hypothetical protein